jgi:hypothetical protein
LRQRGEQAGRDAAAAAAAAASDVAASASANAASSLELSRQESALASESKAKPHESADALRDAEAERDDALRRVDQLLDRLSQVTSSVQDLETQIAMLAEQADEDRTERAAADEIARRAVTELDNEIVEHDATSGALTSALDRIRWLEGRALTYEDYDAKQATPDDVITVAPAYLSDLLDRLEELPFVIFTADRQAAEALDDNLKASSYARRAWDSLLALNDYAAATAAGDWQGNFHAWCRDTPPGRRGLQLGLIAMKESKSTMDGFGRYRVLPCPREVHEDGCITMEAHIKIGDGSPPAPRMHFYDDTAGVTSKIVDVWLCKHLPNPQTATT